MEEFGPKAQKGTHFPADALFPGPGKPVFEQGLKVQMYHAVGESRGHAVGDGLVPVPVACGYDGPAVGQTIFANGAVQNELVAGSLHKGRRRIELIEKKDALRGVGRIGQKGGRTPDSRAFRRDARQAAQIHGIQQDGTNVAQHHAPFRGHLGHDLALAYAGRAPEKDWLVDGDECVQCRHDLSGPHDASVKLNVLSVFFLSWPWLPVFPGLWAGSKLSCTVTKKKVKVNITTKNDAGRRKAGREAGWSVSAFCFPVYHELPDV